MVPSFEAPFESGPIIVTCALISETDKNGAGIAHLHHVDEPDLTLDVPFGSEDADAFVIGETYLAEVTVKVMPSPGTAFD
jgi:hypothetical protein